LFCFLDFIRVNLWLKKYSMKFSTMMFLTFINDFESRRLKFHEQHDDLRKIMDTIKQKELAVYTRHDFRIFPAIRNGIVF